MIITSEIKDLVGKIEESGTKLEINKSIYHLIKTLRINCNDPKNISKYHELHKKDKYTLKKYPLDTNGFAKSFDALTQEEELVNVFFDYNMVVGKGVVSNEICDNSVNRINEIAQLLSSGKLDIGNPDTYKNIPYDLSNTPLLSRGFFEIYHDDSLAQIRQSIKLYLHHILIRGREDLRCSFDRFGLKLPQHKESYAIPLHVDQNPKVHDKFSTVQGILALADCPQERGTFLGVPGSIGYFPNYESMANNLGEYVEIHANSSEHKQLQANKQAIPLMKGDIVTRDSRMAHANTTNISDKIRYVGMVAMGPSKEHDKAMIEARNNGFVTCLGSNNREALMHASKRPRYTMPTLVQNIRNKEDLTLLGKLLYGQEKYSDVL